VLFGKLGLRENGPGVSFVGAAAKNAVLALPPARRAWKRRLLGGGLSGEPPAAARRIFDLHAGAAGAVRPLADADVLEIGPGGNLRVLELFRAAGARRAAAIDVAPWAGDGVAQTSPDPTQAVEYLVPVTVENLPFQDESFDVIYSHTCFQYVANPKAAVAEIARVLRAGGVTSHLIDLRDRSLARSGDPLRFLRYRDWQWRLATSNRLFQVNRWRASDFLAEFRRDGLDARLDVTERVDVNPSYRAMFAPQFRRKSLEDLRIVGAFIVARK